MIESKKNKKNVLLGLLLSIFILHTCSYVQAQAIPDHGNKRVTLIGKDITLLSAFKRIEKQTGLRFNYRPEQLNGKEKVTLNYKEKSLNEVLGALLTSKGYTWKYIDNYISLQLNKTHTEKEIEPLSNTQLADTTVTGIITDRNGNALAGVSIGVVGSRIGASSNSDGSFVLRNVPTNGIILISSVGYETQQVRLNNNYYLRVEMNVVVKDIQPIEVVSTGYQDIPKERATGSFVKVDNKLLNQQTGTNILQRLNGVTNSVYFNIGKNGSSIGPSNKTNITIRGFSTINGPQDPLIVLDNFIYEGDISNINPNDIESITILRDAAASSIWGARAGNGVIVITSKKGKYNQPLKIELNSNFIITDKPDLYYLQQISSADYIDVEQFLYSKGFFNSSFTSSLKPGITPAVEIFRKKTLGQISSADSAAQINALKNIDSRDEYTKHMYQKGITQQYSLNLRGGSGNVAWLLSGAYDRTVSDLSDRIDKVNIRINNTYKPLKNLQVGLGVYYTNQKNSSGKPSYNSITIRSRDVPYLQFADEQGNPIAIARNYRGVYTDTVGGGSLLNWKYYPLEDYKHDRITANMQELLTNIVLDYRIMQSLSLNLNYQYQRQWSLGERLSDLESFYARDLVNLYTNLQATTITQKYPVPIGGIIRKSSASIGSQNIRVQANYNENWFNHSVSAILGGEVREARSDNDAYTLFGYNQDPLIFSNVDFKTTYPVITNGSFRTIPGGPISGGRIVNRFVSAYANILYAFKDRYSLSGSLRRDGANIFGLATNDKFKPLWSLGAGWDISKEPFYNSSWLPLLKMKTTLGYSGNVDLSRSPLPIASYSPSDPYTGFPLANINTINNPSLRWEEVRQWNIAVEFETRNRRITGSVEYYLKKGSDLYGRTPYDYTAWGLSPDLTENVASMKGKGVDIIVKNKIIDRGLKWTADILYSYNSSKTTEYYTSSAKNLLNLNPQNISPVIGKPLYGIVAYKWGGLNSAGDPQGFLNGQLSADYSLILNEADSKGLESGAFAYVGPAIPTSFGSFINEVTWKNVSLSFNFVYRFGYFFQKSSIIYSSLFNNGTGHKDFEKRWKQPGDEFTTNVPAMVYTNYPQFSMRDQFYAQSEINILKGDNIRLQYVNIRYDIDNQINKLPFTHLQFYMNAANLGIIWRANKERLDPEYPASIPVAKSYTIGIRAEF